MTKNFTLAVVWSLLTAALFMFFYFWFPVNIYRQSTVILVLVGGVAFTYAITKSAMYIMRSKEDVLKKMRGGAEEAPGAARDKKHARVGAMLVILVLVSFFGSIVLFLHAEVKMESDEIAQYGIITKGTVNAGHVVEYRKGTFSTLTVGFKLQNGDSSWTTVRMSEQALDNFYKGQELYLVYSPRCPALNEVFISLGELNKFELRTNRTLTIPQGAGRY